MPQPRASRLAARSLPALLSLSMAFALTPCAPPPASAANVQAPASVASGPCKTAAPAEAGTEAARTNLDQLAALPPSDILLLVDGKRFYGEAFPRALGGHADLRGPFDAALRASQALTGLDPAALGRVVTGVSFQKTAASSADGWGLSWVSVTRGVDYGSWLAGVRQRRPKALRESRHGAKTVHVLEVSQAEREEIDLIMMLPLDGNELAFASLDADAFVFGTPAGVRLSLDACAGSGPRVSPELAAAAARAPEASLAAAGMLPPWLTSDIFAADQRVSEEFARAFSSLRLLHFAAESAPDGFAFTLTGGTGGPEHAKALGDILTAIKTLGGLGPARTPRERAGREVLKGASVSSAGAEVRVRVELTQAAAHLWLKRLWADALDLRGVDLNKAGDHEAALDAFTRAIGLDPDNVMAHIHRAGVHSEHGQLDAALADLDKALALDPHNVTAFNNRGLVRVDRKEFDAAIVDLDKALALDPRDAYAYNNRGLARVGKEDLAAALEDFDKALALDPKLAQAYSNRGFVRQRQGDAERAVADFDKALALDPDMVDAYHGRGQARLDLGECDAALADFDKAVALSPKSSTAYNGRGLARYCKGELDAALAEYEKALAFEPTSAIIYYNRGVARTGKEAFDQAVADFDKAIALDPDFFEAYSDRGIVSYQRRDFKRAVVDFDKSIAVKADYAEPHCYRALSLLELKRDAEASRGLKKCFALNPDLRPVFEALAEEIIENRRKSRRAH